MEIFKDIKGYEGKYKIGSCGTVLSTVVSHGTSEHPHGIPMSSTDNGKGYLLVHLRKNGKRTTKYIHRLVAEAFVEKEDGKDVVNHIDFNKRNNDFRNLEWCTQTYNVRYSAKRMETPHKSSQNSTGEKYIFVDSRKNHSRRYRLVMTHFKIDRTFNTIEEAVDWRNAFLESKEALHWVETERGNDGTV